ncbi:YkgJ family cysteine cluster protein [Candidatus Woesearchaeota archaeon]|nr:YkgJ family cysteine cluster protein [Candidatus Woesearchaeota archaeon]
MDNKEMFKICKKCGAKCCKLGGADVTNQEREIILSAGHTDHFVKIDSDHYEMKSKGSICPYLKEDNSCGIYHVRPIACRCFPIHPEFNNNKKEYLLALCPLGKVLPKELIDRMKKDSTRIMDHITKTRFTDTKLPKGEIEAIIKGVDKLKNFILE